MNDSLIDRGKVVAERIAAVSNGSPVPGSRIGGTEPGTGTVPSSRNRPGTGAAVLDDPVPGSQPSIPEPGTEPEKPLYVDIRSLLDGALPEPPSPVLLERSDGHALFYARQVNLLFGDPESGKTWVCLAALARGTNASATGSDDRP